MARLPRAALEAMVGDPRHDLVMAADGRPYQVTTVVLPHAGGTLRVHVSVGDNGWSTDVVIVRTTHLPGPPPRTA